MSSSVDVPFVSKFELNLCNKYPESVLRKLPDWLTICQLPTDDVDSFLWRDIDNGTVTGLVLLYNFCK